MGKAALKNDRGEACRISTEVLEFLDAKFHRSYTTGKRNNKRESFDAFMRRIHGMPSRGKVAKVLKKRRRQKRALEAYAVKIPKSKSKVFMLKSEARGSAILEAAMRRKTKPFVVVKLREIV